MAFGCAGVRCCAASRKAEDDAVSKQADLNLASSCGDQLFLTAEQQTLLESFRSLLGSQGASVKSHHLLRFLVARKWQLQAAFEQYQTVQRWRLENDVDRFRRDAPGPVGALAAKAASVHPDLSCGGVECFPGLRLLAHVPDEGSRFFFGQTVAFGFDKQGHPIHLQKVGIASTRFAAMYRFAGSHPVQWIIDGYIRIQELQAARMEEESARSGRVITKQVVIMDVKGLNFWPDHRAISCFKQFLVISSLYYPETLAIHFFINSPPIFLAFWRFMKRFVDPVTAEKMHILGTDFRCTLLRYIDESQLPLEYGGTNDFDGLRRPRGQEECEHFHGRFVKAIESFPGRRRTDASLKTLAVSSSGQLLQTQKVHMRSRLLFFLTAIVTTVATYASFYATWESEIARAAPAEITSS